MAAGKGSIAFFGTYRPPVPLNIYSTSMQPEDTTEDQITDEKSYNYNSQVIPKPSLEAILSRRKLSSFSETKVTSGFAFVSERTDGLETLHLSLRLDNGKPTKSNYEVLRFNEVYEDEFKGVRMEDSPCFSGNYMIYISTKEEATERRQPWTAVYRTNLETGETVRLTPKETADLSPSISPSGKKIAVASFQFKTGGWTGEIEDLKTDIVLMDIDGSHRELIISNGGWPTWGSEDTLFFHRAVETVIDIENKTKKKLVKKWGVFKADISNGFAYKTHRITPEDIDAMTPAAISATKVAVVTIREKVGAADRRPKTEQYRHIEIFDIRGRSTNLTGNINRMLDHYNPFFIENKKHIGYHRCVSEETKNDNVPKEFDELKCPKKDVGLLRVSGVFPSFSSDGNKLAFVDNNFKKVWIVQKDAQPRVICEMCAGDKVFSPVWNQNPNIDTLYLCVGTPFEFQDEVIIKKIENASQYGFKSNNRSGIKLALAQDLTERGWNSAFPSTNREGTKIVFRSTKDWVGKGTPLYRNLYIMDAKDGCYVGAKPERLTEGKWMDTMCEWSPRDDLIVFSSTRDKPEGAPDSDNGLDPGYYGVFLVSVKDPTVVVRVVGSREFDLAGHLNHPCFSPDGMSIVFTGDLAAVSAEPISLPIFKHSVRPYGDIFSVDLIDTNDIKKNEDMKMKDITRITHSRYEYATPFWNAFSISLISKYYKQNS